MFERGMRQVAIPYEHDDDVDDDDDDDDDDNNNPSLTKRRGFHQLLEKY